MSSFVPSQGSTSPRPPSGSPSSIQFSLTAPSMGLSLSVWPSLAPRTHWRVSSPERMPSYIEYARRNARHRCTPDTAGQTFRGFRWYSREKLGHSGVTSGTFDPFRHRQSRARMSYAPTFEKVIMTQSRTDDLQDAADAAYRCARAI